MYELKALIARVQGVYEAKRGVAMGNPFDDLTGAVISPKQPKNKVEKPHISPRRSKMVNKAHVAALFITLEMEYGALFSKGIQGKENTAAEYWLKRLTEAGIDEMALNEAMARLPAKYPPKVGELIELCRPHTYEARVGHLERYNTEIPEPGEGYEVFRQFKEKVSRNKPGKNQADKA